MVERELLKSLSTGRIIMFDSIMVYICADNDLSNYANQDIDEMLQIPLTQFLQVDQRIQGWGDTQPNSFRIIRRDNQEEKIILAKELNTGDMQSLKDFFSWVESYKINFAKRLLPLLYRIWYN